MSGHSKWATIKRQKGVNDIKRGQLFTKLSKAIAIAVQEGGGISDPEGNFRLRLAIEAARSANMPKENIDRAIARAASKENNDMQEAIYEGFGPGGFSLIVEAVTDNKQRTVAEIKNVFEKNGGTLGNQGSVMYQFEKRGVITVSKNGETLDDILLLAVDNFAEDVKEEEANILIYTKPENLAKSRSGLAEKGIQIQSSELLFSPVVNTTISDTLHVQKALTFIEKIESLDDVQHVYTNLDIPDEYL